MEDVQRISLILVLFAATMGILQARSLSSEEDDGLWKPEHGNREDWLRCHGYPCDQWNKTVNKLKRLRHLAFPDSPVDDYPSSSSSEEDEVPAEIEDTLDGCIWLTPEQVDIITDRLETEHWNYGFEVDRDQGKAKSRQKRKLKDFSSYAFGMWDLPVAWKFDGNHHDIQRNIIRGAFSHWEEQTCVRFRELGVQESFSENHILITRQNSGCHSFIGRIPNNPQQLNLQDSCIGSFGTIVHEIGHALGLWHEQQRADRDGHIRIVKDNLNPFYEGQFVKQSTVHLGVPYDVGSVMHYGAYAGSTNNRPTIETIDPLEQRSLGQRTGLSFNDAKIINFAYCDGVCQRDLPSPCLHGGYQDPNDCSRCRCPDGFTGTYCQDLASSDNGCGGEIQLDANGSPSYLTSPGYYTVGHYDNQQQCNWRITAPKGYNAELEFVEEFAVYCHYSSQCHHWVEVKYNQEQLTTGTQGARFCCNTRPSVALKSEDQEMMVTFRSNWTTQADRARRGFRARVIAVRDESQPTEQPTTVSTTPKTTTTENPARPSNNECQKMDVVFVLDSSGSVKEDNWKRGLTFAKQLLSNFPIGPEDVRAGVVSYGNEATAHIKLDDHDTKEPLFSAIDAIPFKDQWTNTAAGLKVAREEVFAKSPRGDARKVVIMMTDGESNRNAYNTLPEAKTTREAGIEILVMAMGDQANLVEASGIAANEGQVFTVSSYVELMNSGPTNTIMNYLCGEEGGQTGIPVNTWSCSFERSRDAMCGMTQDDGDDFDWTRQTGATPSSETGPTNAADGDFYIFIEASDPRKPNDVARILTPSMMDSGDRCVQYKYNMNGHHINNLSIMKVTTSGTSTELARHSKNMGDRWMQGEVYVNMASGDRVAFVGQRGNAFSGDIALDDLKILMGTCSE